MQRLIDFFARQGLFAELITILLMGIGLHAMFNIKREVFPNVQYDIITVYTIFPGAAPSEVEKLITNPLEQELKEVDGIKKIFSTSVEGVSGIVIQLDPDQTTQEEAKADIEDVIDRYKDLPVEAEDPTVTAIESTLIPVVEVGVMGGDGLFNLKETARYVEKELEKIKGVARVDVRGEREYEIRVEVSAQKLKAHQLSFTEIVQALREQNVSIPGGTFSQIKNNIETDVIVRTEGQFKDADDVKKTVLRSNDLGKAIYLSDVADVQLSLKKQQIAHRVNGRESIRLVVMKKEKADAVTVVDDVRALLDSGLNSDRIKNVEFEMVNDLSLLIRRRLGVLSSNLIVGLILVVLILSMFLPFKVSLVTSAGIPFSFLGTMAIFYHWDVSLNLITMMGLIIVIGMLVDDAIVVTENAVREMEDGKDPVTAAVQGTQRIWSAIFASVMTTVLAFYPMTIMSGIFGKFVYYIPVGVILALSISLLECYFILPYHIGRWIRLKDIHKKPTGLKAYFEKAWNKLDESYGRFLYFVTRRRYWMLLAFFGFLVITVINVSQNMRLVLFPPEGIDQFIIKAKAPIGTTLEQTLELMRPIEERVKNLPKEELKNFVTTAGEFRQRDDEPGERGSHYAQVMVYLTAETQRERVALDIIESLRQEFEKTKGDTPLHVTFERLNPGPPVGAPISIGVQGEDYNEIMPLVDEIVAELQAIPGTQDVSHNYSAGKEQTIVQVRNDQARSVGLTAQMVGQTVLAAFEGVEATTIRELEDEIDIRVSLPEKEKRGRENGIGSFDILNSFGQLIPLKSIADFKTEKGIEFYAHVNNSRQVTISGDVDVNLISATEVSNRIRAKEHEYLTKYPKLSLNFAGEDEDTQESLGSLMRAFILAFVLIYFLLILTFQSFIWPVVIVLAIPIGTSAVTWALFLHREPLSFMGLLGVVALAGVIVNNAIVFVDFVLYQRSLGMNPTESIIKAGQLRLRPIVLTTMTTVFGILPTAYGIGGLDPFIVPIAIALGWGLLVGAILTSLFLPAFVHILDDVASLPSRWLKKDSSHS